MSTQPKEPNGRKGVSGLAIPAGLLIGMGLGFLTDNLVAGLFLGLGSGFVAMIVLRIWLREW